MPETVPSREGVGLAGFDSYSSKQANKCNWSKRSGKEACGGSAMGEPGLEVRRMTMSQQIRIWDTRLVHNLKI